VVDEVGVQRVVARDEDREGPLARAPGASGLLPDRRDGPGPAGEHDGVQPRHVQAELEGVGGGDAHEVAGLQAPLEHRRSSGR
jgi:hypothetical protein